MRIRPTQNDDQMEYIRYLVASRQSVQPHAFSLTFISCTECVFVFLYTPEDVQVME